MDFLTAAKTILEQAGTPLHYKEIARRAPGDDAGEHPPAAPMFPLTVRAGNKPEVYAQLLSSKGEMQFQGRSYITPSSAGKATAGWKACNGRRYWRYRHPETQEWRLIDELRTP